MRNGLLLLLLAFAGQLTAQIQNPVSWETSYKQIDKTGFELIFTADMKSGWTIYSQFTDEGGPIPTSFNFDDGAHFERVGKVEELGKKKSGPDPLFDGVNVIKFSKSPVVFKQKITIKDINKPITGYLEFMTCNDEQCLPPDEVDFNFALKADPNLGNGAVEEPKSPEQEQVEVAENNLAPEETEEVAAALNDTESTNSGMLDPVKWDFELKQIDGETAELLFTAKVEDGWTIYSQRSNDDGPVPTSFTFEAGEHFEKIGVVEESGKLKEGPDPLFDGVMVAKLFGPEVVFSQKVKIKDASQAIKGYLEFMTCNDKQCLTPTEVDFNFSLPTVAAEDIAAANSGSGSLKEIDQVIPAIKASYKAPVGDCGAEEIVKDQSLLWTFVLGFLGGLVALLTPCVFPMIPLTVSFFTKSSSDKRKGIRNALIYGLSIIVIYVAIGLIITGVFGATALNELSTNWIANTLFFLIFLFFAFSFFGYYEITLPESWANRSDRMADQGGLIGIFFMAFTLALVSFSCTGPIIGSAIVQSATSKLGPAIVMLGFSTALALPFGLFAAFPGWLNSLPRSGSWMNSVKVVLGFLELALALKFLSVADMTMHWNILPYELFMGLWVLIFAAMTAYLFGFIKFPHDSPMKKLSPTRGFFAITSLALTIYLASGFLIDPKTKVYSSKSLMSGLAPPAGYNFLLPEPEVDPIIKAKYPSFTKCANNLDCFKDYYEGLAYAKEQNKPIMLDFTGYGCVNCRKTEEHIWIEDRVWNKLAKDFVLVSLYVDDRKPLEQLMISKTRQKRLRNVGHKWADFQIVNFEQNSQPLYVMMSPAEQVLAPPRGYKDSVKEYAEFLDCGLKTFTSLNDDGTGNINQLGEAK